MHHYITMHTWMAEMVEFGSQSTAGGDRLARQEDVVGRKAEIADIIVDGRGKMGDIHTGRRRESPVVLMDGYQMGVGWRHLSKCLHRTDIGKWFRETYLVFITNGNDIDMSGAPFSGYQHRFAEVVDITDMKKRIVYLIGLDVVFHNAEKLYLAILDIVTLDSVGSGIGCHLLVVTMKSGVTVEDDKLPIIAATLTIEERAQVVECLIVYGIGTVGPQMFV